GLVRPGAPSPDPPERVHRHDPPERVQTRALKRLTETKRQGRAGQTSCTNVHKANLGSQLSIFCYGLLRPGASSPDPPERVHRHDPPERVQTRALKRLTETKRQGRAGQTSCTNVHKANLGSQLSIF